MMIVSDEWLKAMLMMVFLQSMERMATQEISVKAALTLFSPAAKAAILAVSHRDVDRRRNGLRRETCTVSMPRHRRSATPQVGATT